MQYTLLSTSDINIRQPRFWSHPSVRHDFGASKARSGAAYSIYFGHKYTSATILEHIRPSVTIYICPSRLWSVSSKKGCIYPYNSTICPAVQYVGSQQSIRPSRRSSERSKKWCTHSSQYVGSFPAAMPRPPLFTFQFAPNGASTAVRNPHNRFIPRRR